MKWDDSLPSSWDDATDSPPATEIVAKAESAPRGLFIRAPGESGAYVFLEGAAVDLDQYV